MTRWRRRAAGAAACSLIVATLARADGPPDVGLQPIRDERPGHDLGPFAGRWGKETLEREGGGPGTESAVQAALLWLHRHQSPDGRWDADGWGERCQGGGPCRGPGTNQGKAGDDVGVTALALLAHLGNGHSHVCGRFARRVRDGLSWLCSRQAEDGSLRGEPGGQELAGEALAALALAESYAMTRDPALRPFAQRALGSCGRRAAQLWRSEERPGRDSTTLAAWLVQALWAGEKSGLEVPAEALRGAEPWLRRAVEPADEPARAADSIFSRVLVGAELDGMRDGVRLLTASPPAWPEGEEARGTVDLAGWHSATNAIFHAGHHGDWTNWRDRLQRALLPAQRTDGCVDGSWDPAGRSCPGGRVAATALNALSLEVFYRLSRLR